MTSKHTPGPWTIEGETLVIGRGLFVCKMSTNTMAALERRANARLIAAAPELLEALKAVQQQCFFDDDNGTIGVSEDVVIPPDLFNRICAAIAKATGAA